MNDHDSSAKPAPEEPSPAEDADASPEPTLASSGVEFTEPVLGDAAISQDVADSVELERVAAEAAAVEAEAAQSTALPVTAAISAIEVPAVDFSIPKKDLPLLGQEPSPVTDDAGDSPELPTPPAAGAQSAAPHTGRGIDDGSGWYRPETPWQPRANAWKSADQVARGQADAAALAASGGGEASGPETGALASTQPPQEQAPVVTPAQEPVVSAVQPASRAANKAQAAKGGEKNKLFVVLGVAILGVALLGLLIWLIASLVSGGSTQGNTTPAAATSSTTITQASKADVLFPQVSPLNWVQGDCLRGFTTISNPADVVACSSPHSAQLVGTFAYAKSDAFPGADTLKAKAQALCQSVQYTKDVNQFKGLVQMPAYPTEETWNTAGDRRVDCLVQDPSGDNLTVSLIK